MTKTNSYRADIDGLRAIAVLLVILFHADFCWFKGGYTGVDVFFVISGYLITKSINKEMLGSTFSFKSFYLRRIRRILPVLVFVMLIVTIPAYFFLFANQLEAYGRTAIHTILSTNNFHLLANGKNYFLENTELIPLLHTWSLSVEEQFYVIWPPILLVLHRFLNLKMRLYFILSFILIGIVLSVYLAHNFPKMAYFLLPARLFELSLGAGLALFWDHIPKISKTKNNVISVVGLMFVLLPTFLLDTSSIFPGFNALWPCLGAVLLILSGKQREQSGIVNKVLQTKGPVFVGLLSYSMYLWHWPIFVFIKYLGYDLDISLVIGAMGLTLLLSYFSWKYVEQPFRYRFKFNFSKTLLVIVLPCLILTSTIYAVFDAANGFPERFSGLTEFNKNTNYPNKVRRKCYNTFIIGNCEDCGLGIKKDTLDGVLLGDSFANHSAAFLDVLAKDAGLYLHDSAAGGYPLLYDIDDVTGSPLRDTVYGIKRLEYAKKFKTVFIASNWERFMNAKSKNYQFVLETIKELLRLGKNIVIIDPLRHTDPITLHKMKMYKTNNISLIKKEDLLVPFYERDKDYIVYAMKRKFPGIIVINLNDAMCHDGICDYEIGGSIVYRNGNHLNTSGATLIARKYLEQKSNPLLLLK